MENPCVTEEEDEEHLHSFSVLNTSDVLNISGRETSVKMYLNALARSHSKLNDDMIEETWNCQDLTVPYIWELLDEFDESASQGNSSNLSLPRLKQMYRMDLILATLYRVMAEDWDFGDICSTRMDSFNKARDFLK